MIEGLAPERITVPDVTGIYVRFFCEHCEAPVVAPLARTGEDGRCPACRAAITVAPIFALRGVRR
ncbi:MAG: hypothetical protein HY722_05495 [Planctomycetes bacterium]|nr:hypothetical protein [Planctomycetota bacterium]